MNTDPVADYLTRIRNANQAGLKTVEIPSSNLKKEITKILLDQGFILNYKVGEDEVQGKIKIALKYDSFEKTLVAITFFLLSYQNVNVNGLFLDGKDFSAL